MIIAASGALGFVQEHSAGRAVDALMARVRVEVEVRRGGRETSVPAEDVVVGDVLVLSAGDVVPGDCRVIESHGLLVDEAARTGESYRITTKPASVSAATATPALRGIDLQGHHHTWLGPGNSRRGLRDWPCAMSPNEKTSNLGEA